MTAVIMDKWKVRTPLDRFNDGEDYGGDEDWSEDYPRKVTIQGRHEICAMSGVHGDTIEEAHIIAAAPDMYAALAEALKYIYDYVDHQNQAPIVETIETALAKADGKQ